MVDLAHTILSRVDAAENYLEPKRHKWDDYEKLFNNELQDSISALTKSNIFDPVLSTMQIERSNRVMAQLQTGKFKEMSRNDEGGAKLMNLTMEKYVLPNANSQFDFLTKCRMVDLYSNIYGNFFAFIDWVVKEKGYIGPDMWLINIRDVFPQVGAVSLEDSDYVVIRSWKSIEYFKGLAKTEGFKEISKVVQRLEDITGDKDSRGFKEKSSREYQEYADAVSSKGTGFFKVYSMYERDRWVDYVPGADTIIRDIDNPNDDGELPVVCKYSMPLLDDFMGLGDSERGKSQQMALNSLWNLNAGAITMSIFPPVVLNKSNIAHMNSIKWGPAEKWLAKGDVNNLASVLNLTPQGVNTFNANRQAILSSLQTQFGTSFTNVSESVSSDMGKTPQALKMQAAREGARDSADRFYMESFLTKVMKRFATLISKKQPKALQIRLFKDEIDEIMSQYPDFAESYNEKTGKLKINKGKFASCLFDYEIVSGSTYATDKSDQQQELMNTLNLLTANMTKGADGNVTSPMIDRLASEGREVRVGELVSRILANSGVQGWNRIVVDKTNGDPEQFKANQQMQQHADQFQQAIAQMAQSQNTNQIPPMQDQSMPMDQGMEMPMDMGQQMPPMEQGGM